MVLLEDGWFGGDGHMVAPLTETAKQEAETQLAIPLVIQLEASNIGSLLEPCMLSPSEPCHLEVTR